MSKNVNNAFSSGIGGPLPDGCQFEALQFYDGNTNAPGGWYVRPKNTDVLWRDAPFFREWSDVLNHIGGAT